MTFNAFQTRHVASGTSSLDPSLPSNWRSYHFSLTCSTTILSPDD
ncbi:glycosyl hydrolase family 65 protein [Pleurocapsa sp. PCC 7327]